jgi:Protein of unknown function (DUF429)
MGLPPLAPPASSTHPNTNPEVRQSSSPGNPPTPKVVPASLWRPASLRVPARLRWLSNPLAVAGSPGPGLDHDLLRAHGHGEKSLGDADIVLGGKHGRTGKLAGVRFLALAQARGWRYSDGRHGPPATGHVLSESYPYGTLVGAAELGYDTERPRYKRKPLRLPAAQWRRRRAANCDTLIRRIGLLETADPPLRLRSHPVTRQLAEQSSPADDVAYKHREDLIDALLCAWTAAFWARHGLDRCQVLGPTTAADDPPAATIIVPARPEQRR